MAVIEARTITDLSFTTRGGQSLQSGQLNRLDSGTVVEILQRLSPENAPTVRLSASQELVALAHNLQHPRTIRGSAREAAKPGIEKLLLDQIYEICEVSDGRIRNNLITAVTSIGDKDFVKLAEKIIKQRGVDYETYSSTVFAVSRIGGTAALEWLAIQKLIQPIDRQVPADFALRELCEK